MDRIWLDHLICCVLGQVSSSQNKLLRGTNDVFEQPCIIYIFAVCIGKQQLAPVLTCSTCMTALGPKVPKSCGGRYINYYHDYRSCSYMIIDDHGCIVCKFYKGKGKVAYENYIFHENSLCQNQFDLVLW